MQNPCRHLLLVVVVLLAAVGVAEQGVSANHLRISGAHGR
jgi:hypothetical protein